MFSNNPEIPIQEIHDPLFKEKKIKLFIKRLDLTHPNVSGNKWFKLKYNIEQAQIEGHDTLLTFGGAYSNHIAATAFAGKKIGFKTIGIIRGEEHLTLNHTLGDAEENSMILKYIDRDSYRRKTNPDFVKQLKNEFGNFYHIPEGGSNVFAVKGCTEILEDCKDHFDYVALACGTGSTLAGIALSLSKNQQAIGFPALKGGDFLNKEIANLINSFNTYYNSKFHPPAGGSNFELITDYHFGGYAKTTPELFNFVSDFFKRHCIQLDYIYTGKMIYGIFDLIRKNYFKSGNSILVIHTGGLQGNG